MAPGNVQDEGSFRRGRSFARSGVGADRKCKAGAVLNQEAEVVAAARVLGPEIGCRVLGANRPSLRPNVRPRQEGRRVGDRG